MKTKIYITKYNPYWKDIEYNINNDLFITVLNTSMKHFINSKKRNLGTWVIYVIWK